MSCLCVLADDLTGAMDAGVQMLKKGYAVKVTFGTDGISDMIRDADVLVVDTESRNIPSEKAFTRVKEYTEELIAAGCSVVYKKIDSTLRGNIGTELEAVLSSTRIKIIIMAPALPFNKRTTVNGKHYVNGIQLQDTEQASDPFSPINESEISKVIAHQSSISQSVINIKTIRDGEEQVVNELKKCVLSGVQVVVMDAIDDGDLLCIARASTRLGNDAMLCGSAGLFQYMDEMMYRPAYQVRKIRHMPRRKVGNPILALSGSPASASKIQIAKTVEANSRAVLVKVDLHKILKGGESERTEKARVINETIGLLAEGSYVIVDMAGEGKAAILYASGGDRNHLENESRKIQNILSSIAQTALKTVKLRGIVLFGGDTAINVSKALGATGIEIIREIEPFIPAGLLIGGPYDNLPVVTKSGGFGKEDSLISILKTLE